MASRTARAVLTAVAFASFTVLAASPAQAQTAADKERARALMDDGDAKRDAKDYKNALKSYADADAIMHVPTTGIEVARMQVQLGQLLEARDTVARVLRYPAKPKEPPPFTAARKQAEELDADLARRIPGIKVNVTGADPSQAPEITIDGEKVAPAQLSAPRKVNPGNHVVVAKAGAVEKREDVAVAERETKTVDLDLKPKPEEKPTVATTDDQSGSSASTGRILMFGGFGLALVGVGVGTVTGVLSLNKVNDIKPDCVDNKCPATRANDIDSAKSLGNISTIAFIAGGVGAAVGVIGLLMTTGNAEVKTTTTGSKSQSRPHARAVVGPSYLGVAGTF